MALSVGCLFCGMGGFATGFATAGFDIRWANDVDCHACTTFSHRFPSARVFQKSATELRVDEDSLDQVDALIAGFPCQSFSQAGSRRGFGDERGKLFHEIPRLLEQMKPEIKPRLVALENVPHLMHGGEGEWFATVRR